MKSIVVRFIVLAMLSISVIAATIPPPTVTEKTVAANCCKKRNWYGKCTQYGTLVKVKSGSNSASGSATLSWLCR